MESPLFCHSFRSPPILKALPVHSLANLLVSIFQITDPWQLVYVTGIFSILSLLLASASAIGCQVIVSKYVGSLGHWLRMQLLCKYYSQPYAYFVSRNSAVLTKKANADVFVFTAFVLAPLFDLAAKLFTTVIILAGLLVLEPVATLAAGLSWRAFTCYL